MRNLLVLLFLVPLLSICQSKDDVVTVRYKINTDNEWGMSPEFEYVVKGTPYLDKTYKMGAIILNNNTTTKSLMRYNIFRDYFELMDAQQQHSILGKEYHNDVILEGRTYKFIDYLDRGKPASGYFIVHSNGKTMLYSKFSKTITKYEKPAHGYESFSSPKFINHFEYYIKRENKPAKKVDLNKRDVLYTIEDKFTILKAYVKEHKLRLKTEEEVIHLLTFYDSLENHN
ncbi:MAG: hypothetical protein COA50_02945 [Flavobacteriaceae bacterium]|nr:MAG: hypothetical protein COA50_02945 [Flavobacteriaceae bacterium]